MGKYDTKYSAGGLGKSLVRGRTALAKRSGKPTKLHTTELNDGYDWGCLQSVTEQSQLDDFLLTAELTGTEFETEKLNVTFVNKCAVVPGLVNSEQRATLQKEHGASVIVPRRPAWDEATTPDELKRREDESFLDWRRQLAALQEIEGIVLTPFEKNLEVWRQLWRVIEKSDIVLQTVDARNPFLYRCEDLEKYVLEVSPEKKNMLLLNKADLLTVEHRKHWARYLDSINMPAVFFSALEETNRLSSKSETAEDSSTSSNNDSLTQDVFKQKFMAGTVFNREELMEFVKGHCAKEEQLTIGLVGYPNVGKSSTINALFARKQTSVSMTPGKTKHFQTLIVEPGLCVCDCPGLVLPSFIASKAELIVSGILPIDQMRDHVPPVTLAASRFPRHILESMYGIMLPEVREGEDPDRPPTSEELLDAHGYNRGFMTQRGMPDNPRSSRYILKDYVSGKLLYCHAPPDMAQEEYHKFPPPPAKSQVELTRQQAMIYAVSHPPPLDAAFFRQTSLQAYRKGVQKVGATQAGRVEALASTSDTGSDPATDKPWKKHNNRNKREKLRRVYSDLDQ